LSVLSPADGAPKAYPPTPPSSDRELVLMSRTPSELDEVASEIKSGGGRATQIVVVDQVFRGRKQSKCGQL
jgi:short-subunit dehydrogenase